MADVSIHSNQVVIDMDDAGPWRDPSTVPFQVLMMKMPREAIKPEAVARHQQARWRFTLTATAEEMRQRWRDHAWDVVEFRRAARELGIDLSLGEVSKICHNPYHHHSTINWLEDELVPA